MTTNETYFLLENDYIGYIQCDIKSDALKFYSYVDAVNALHEKLEDINFNWVNEEHPKSKWGVDMVTGEKRSLVYRISATKAKKLIPTKNFILD